MHKSKILTGITFIVCLLLLVMPVDVQAIPQLPSSFHGTVIYNNTYVADGTLIQATINGQVVAFAYSQTYEGKSVFSLSVPSDEISTPLLEGGKEGDIVQFKIGGTVASQTGTWHSGTNVEVNLSVTSTVIVDTPAPTPTSYPTQTPIVIVRTNEPTQNPIVIGQTNEPSQTPDVTKTATASTETAIILTTETAMSLPPGNNPQSDPIVTETSQSEISSNNSTLLIIFVSVLVLVGLVFSVWFFRKKKSKES